MSLKREVNPEDRTTRERDYFEQRNLMQLLGVLLIIGIVIAALIQRGG